jgi:hypothetical protein
MAQTFDETLLKTIKDIPYGFLLSIHIQHDEVILALLDPDNEELDLTTTESTSVEESLGRAVDIANAHACPSETLEDKIEELCKGSHLAVEDAFLRNGTLLLRKGIGEDEIMNILEDLYASVKAGQNE